jgi:hypothetical protein
MESYSGGTATVISLRNLNKSGDDHSKVASSANLDISLAFMYFYCRCTHIEWFLYENPTLGTLILSRVSD